MNELSYSEGLITMLNGGLSEYFADKKDDFHSSGDEREFLSDFSSRFGFSNITYFFVSSRFVTGDAGALMTSYAKDWQDHYFDMNYDEVDPIVLAGRNNFLPIDWAQIPKTKKCTKRFFGEAKEFGISDQGVTIPVRGASGETALVSLNADQTASEWSGNLKHNVSDFVYFSYLFHCEALKKLAAPVESDPTHISRREKDVLQWAALGKTAWETSKILDMSARTVEFYMRNAMSKLGAATKAQAVSKAIHQGHVLADAYVQSVRPPAVSERQSVVNTR